jgi:hypothetical protein
MPQLFALTTASEPQAVVLDSAATIAAYVALAIIVVAAAVAFTIAVRASLAKDASEWSRDEAENWLRIVTVVALLITATFLGVLGQLTGMATTFLGTIAGFVLGGVQKKKRP